ncbi:hypothetical protein CYMTET_4235 [Cymbomonas tetramitiformis]|uniref:Steroid 5-alpha-reductase DET2 n=1 Tax=Cymbomonas tetramitiformis TaxID=36881 RepID=A0AAE0H1S3_9CHLO|nr:hypothetical protein CYMTET_4235 [Cymbomonas tetramitiformis]
MIACGVVTLLFLTFGITAPYGKYSRPGFGISLNAKLAWMVQEAPSFLVVAYMAHNNSSEIRNAPNDCLLCLFLFHYFNRTFIYPLRLRGGKPTPLFVFLMAFAFTTYNGVLQGQYMTQLASMNRQTDLAFWVGLALFTVGWFVNYHSDNTLRSLRRPGETGYKIPRGGMFEYVSGANFLGEIVEWTGWAVASQSLPATAFAIFTACNIGPRAYAHHNFYLKNFPNYPRHRKAIIPFIL